MVTCALGSAFVLDLAAVRSEVDGGWTVSVTLARVARVDVAGTSISRACCCGSEYHRKRSSTSLADFLLLCDGS
jgi:hypothetical protein